VIKFKWYNFPVRNMLREGGFAVCLPLLGEESAKVMAEIRPSIGRTFVSYIQSTYLGTPAMLPRLW
jgi:hypothetical protein